MRWGGEKVLLPALPSCLLPVMLPAMLGTPDTCRAGAGGVFTKGEGVGAPPEPAAVHNYHHLVDLTENDALGHSTDSRFMEKHRQRPDARGAACVTALRGFTCKALGVPWDGRETGLKGMVVRAAL